MLGKSDIIARLRKEILPLGGCKDHPTGSTVDIGLAGMQAAFPGGVFPLGAVHELLTAGPESAAASAGFIAAIIGCLMKAGGVVLWVGSQKALFPPALLGFGITPENIIFIDVTRDKEVLWVMEEALKCKGLVAVVGQIQQLTLTTSRRLQLAVEQSRVTGFVLRPAAAAQNPTSCIARWRITALPSALPADTPGVGFPRWKVVLEKVRNGKPGTWDMEYKAGQFRLLTSGAVVPQPQQQRKTG